MQVFQCMSLDMRVQIGNAIHSLFQVGENQVIEQQV